MVAHELQWTVQVKLAATLSRITSCKSSAYVALLESLEITGGQIICAPSVNGKCGIQELLKISFFLG